MLDDLSIAASRADPFLRQKEVTEMQCDLLISYFKNPETVTLVKENIFRAQDGSFPHQAAAFNLVFKKAFEVKKLLPQAGVKLECVNSHCPRSLFSYSSIGPSVYCASCGFYVRCANCGCNRLGEYTSCQSCKKRFI